MKIKKDHSKISQVNARKKRLGQFFTGERLAKLLFSLSSSSKTKVAIDPMCGTGDMLHAALTTDPSLKVWGIEIDPLVSAQTKIKVLKGNIITGSAFSLKVLKQLHVKHYDLVITNPPYVRYQNSKTVAGLIDIPSSEKAREDLCTSIDYLAEDETDKKLFKTITEKYSGLSDLAVPSWILCALLTKKGGTLALVVPESWLSRDYAGFIHYILARWFDLQYIIEDSNARWFPEAQVKTTLLIAKKVERKKSALDAQQHKYLHVRISADAISGNSVVGNVYPKSKDPDQLFAKEVSKLNSRSGSKIESMWSAKPVKVKDLSSQLFTSETGVKILNLLESGKHTESKTNSVGVSFGLSSLIDEDKVFESLIKNDIHVGQGLRTGANIFFYSDFLKKTGGLTYLKFNNVFELEDVTVGREMVKTVLRKQSELPNGYAIKKNELNGRVLMLSSENLDPELKALIKRAEKVKVGNVTIPNLSAVKTNVRVNGKTRTDWYVLPSLTKRHVPDLFIPRVNGAYPRTFINDSEVVVDANFSALWLGEDSPWDKYSLLAFLNSKWAIANMEFLGSVMGGGALKLEATHLRRLPVPKFTEKELENLSVWGNELVKSEDSSKLKDIDALVFTKVFGETKISQKTTELQKAAQERINERKRKHVKS